jgi:hypothetical protein
VLNEVITKSQKFPFKKRKKKKEERFSYKTVKMVIIYCTLSPPPPPPQKSEKNVSSLAHLFYQFAYILTRRVGEGEGEGGGGWEGGWVIYHLLGCVLPPPAHAEKTHNKHSQDTELMDGWPAKFLRKRKDSFIIIAQILRKFEKANAFC